MKNDQLPPEIRTGNFLEGFGQYAIPPEKLVYKQCFFAFLDILGYKQLIEQLGKDAPVRLYSILKNAQEGHSTLYESVRFKLLSDSVLIWSEGDSPIHFWNVLNVVMLVRHSFLKNGLLLRGGISLGQNFIERDIIVSPALIAAYQLEQLAVFPRVLIDEDAAKIASSGTSSDALGQKYILVGGYARKIELDNIENDFDGLMIVKTFTESNGTHFLRTGRPSHFCPGDAPPTPEQSEAFKQEGESEVVVMREHLLAIRPNSKDLRILQKYKYLLGKFNLWVESFGDFGQSQKIPLDI